MKSVFQHLANNMKAGIATGAVLALALLLPTATIAQDAAKLGNSLGVANESAGDTAYKQSVNASQGQVVKVRMYYVNQEAADSNKVAQNVRAKITLPAAGKVQTVKASVQADGGTAVTQEVSVNTDRNDGSLQFIPGSATWKHNTGTAEAPKVVESKISDEIVTGGQGVVLENQKPGDAYGATVSIQARVASSGVKATVQSQKQGETGKWSASNSANPGDIMRFMVGYQNTTGATQTGVTVRDILPSGASIVPGTTTIVTNSQPNGAKVDSDNVAAGGISIGNYAAGANAYVIFEAKLPTEDKLACGNNALKNAAVVKTAEAGEYYASSVTNVARNCSGTPTTPTQPVTPTAVYSCDGLTVNKLGGRKVESRVSYTARDGATLKAVTYNFGDGSTPLVTDKTTVQYTYPKDGNFTVSASLLMTVGGKDQVVTNEACNKPVSLAPVATPPAPTAPTATPGALPDTGPGEVFGLFAVVAVAGTIAHRLYLTRRLSRAS